ncbi:MAG: nuclear transport factor 2 family protein [Gemmatimonadota bacterium]|nr:nuclear transport factor 2 family protein [Gemmatimonadota bacterium]
MRAASRAVVLFALAGAACTAPPGAAPAAGPAPSGDRTANRGGGPGAILALNRALADSLLAADAARTDTVARLGYQEGVMAMLTPDAVYLRAGQPMAFGQLSIQRLLAIAPPGRRASYRWQPVRAGVSRDGLAAYTVGIAVAASARDSGGPALGVSRYVAFWLREPGGVWRVRAYAEVGLPAANGTVLSGPGEPRSLADFPRRDSLVRALEATDDAFAAASREHGAASAFAAFAAPDAMIFSGPRVVVGPAAIGDAYDAPGAGDLDWRAVAGDVAPSGDLGFTVGRYIYRAPGGRATGGKYLTVWLRLPNGRWRFVADGGNADPAAAR